MKQVQLRELPSCDIHKHVLHQGDNFKAAYDGPTTLGQHAYMCEVCFKTYGIQGSSITVRIVKGA